MNKCNHCNVIILDRTEYCPLCHNVLERTSKDDFGKSSYPNIYSVLRRSSLVKRILAFLWVALTFLNVYINYRYFHDYWWSVLVSAGLLAAIAIVSVMMNSDSTLLARIFVPIICGLSMSVIVDVVFGFQRWSLNYVFPGVIIGCDVTFLVLMIIFNTRFQEYLVYQIIMILVGIIPLVLIGLKLITDPLLSEISFITSILLFIGTLIIGGYSARVEMKRRFHL